MCDNLRSSSNNTNLSINNRNNSKFAKIRQIQLTLVGKTKYQTMEVASLCAPMNQKLSLNISNLIFFKGLRLESVLNERI